MQATRQSFQLQIRPCILLLSTTASFQHHARFFSTLYIVVHWFNNIVRIGWWNSRFCARYRGFVSFTLHSITLSCSYSSQPRLKPLSRPLFSSLAFQPFYFSRSSIFLTFPCFHPSIHQPTVLTLSSPQIYVLEPPQTPPSPYLHIHSCIFPHSPMLQNPISEHPVEISEHPVETPADFL